MRVARGDAGRLTIATVLVPFMDTFERGEGGSNRGWTVSVNTVAVPE